MSNFPLLETPRLLLTELVPSDADALFQLLGNPAVMGLSGSDPLADIDSARAVIADFANWRLLPNPCTRWAIRLKGDPTLIGTCGVFAWNHSWNKCSVGYELDLAWQKKGIMFEALTAVLTWCFYGALLHRVEAQVHPENCASIKLLTSLGFVEEGRLREGAHWGGQIHDMLQYGLLWTELQSLPPR